jgi:hypothetical protein
MKTRPVAVRLLPLLLLLPSCAGHDPIRTAADRATFDWFAPMVRGYVAADPKLDEAARATHLRGIDAWGARIVADEAAAGAR